VSKKLLEIRYFQAVTYLKEPEPVLSWAAGVGRDRGNDRNGYN
jgi:hypothetical protein